MKFQQIFEEVSKDTGFLISIAQQVGMLKVTAAQLELFVSLLVSQVNDECNSAEDGP